MFKQYGKTSASLIVQKKSFFKDNKSHIKKQKKIADVYIKQPLRIACKNCGTLLGSEVDFIKDDIGYKICKLCTHLNGAYDDTDEFCNEVYAESDGQEEYAKNYVAGNINDFNYRVSSIYIPKAEFLYTALVNKHENPHELSYLDFGAGAGFFVDALRKVGLKNVSGSEVSKCQVEYGNKMMGVNILSEHEMDDTKNLLAETDADIVSLIGVLEHLQNPRMALESIRSNSRIKYIYISVPIFSLTVFLEMISPNVYHRQLHGGHTHLYTEKSLRYLAEEFGFDIVSEWWFGADVVDLYRHIYVHMEENKFSKNLMNTFTEMIVPVIDATQLEIDKKHVSSEVHMLLKLK